jgi:hypothetical protein
VDAGLPWQRHKRLSVYCLVSALKCADPGLPDGIVFAFQMDTARGYATTWNPFNKWPAFTSSSACTSCPPSGGATTRGAPGSPFSALQNW